VLSPPRKIAKRTSASPVIAIASIANSGCTIFNGMLTATVIEGSTTGVTAGYDFNWFAGAVNISNTNIASNLNGGDYIVNVVDQVSPGRLCDTTMTVHLDNHYPL